MRKSPKSSIAQNVTIKDIAEHLGISHSTVSRALSDHPYTNAGTKDKVRRAVERLGYVPNAAARNLRSDKGSLVGLILPEIQNELFGTAAQILSQRCLKNGLQMVFAASEDDAQIEYEHVLALREARARGIILTPTPRMLDKTLALLQDIPVVQFSRRHKRLAAPSVSVDGERGCLVATRHLLQLGHRRIAYVGMESDRSTGAERLVGYLKAHAEYEVVADPSLSRLGPSGPEFGNTAVMDILQSRHPPTALLLGTNALTLGALKAMRQLGMEAPRDLSVVGFGDPSWYALWSPGITTIGVPQVEMAEAAASHLMRQLAPPAQGVADPAPLISIEPTFLVRGTTGHVPAAKNARGLTRSSGKGQPSAGSRAAATRA